MTETPLRFEPEEFDRWAAAYDQDVQSGGFPFEGYARMLGEILTRSAVRPGLRVVDIGAGTGNLAQRFSMAGCTVTGLDFSGEMLAIARRRFPHLTLAQADLRGPWPPEISGRFDRIVSAYVFHHFPLDEKVSLLRSLADERLEPGGRMMIGDVAFKDESAQAAVRGQQGEAWSEEYYWIMDAALPALRAAGFQAAYTPISFCAGLVELTPA